MVLTGPVLSMKLNHECSNFQKSQTSPSICQASTAFSYVQPYIMLAKPNPARNQGLGSTHTYWQRYATVTASAVLSIRTGKWIKACWEANKAINKAKVNNWKDLLQSSMSNVDSPDVWNVIPSLNGIIDTNQPNEAMFHNGLIITNTKSKANIFINHYARVSKLHMTKEDHDLNCLPKKHFNTPSVDDDSCSSINMFELLSVIQKMKQKGAAGPDNIPPTFLKSLGPLALQELLSIFNASFHHIVYGSGELPWTSHC